MPANQRCKCGCAHPTVGVRYCGFFGPNPSSISQYAWVNFGGISDVIQAYIDNVNAYDMSSIPPGYMRLLGHDGFYNRDVEDYAGTGALDGTTFDYPLSPHSFGTVSPCTVAGFGVVDPFFQGAPLTPNSFTGIQFSYDGTTEQPAVVNAIVRCQVVYASSGTIGAMQDFDNFRVVTESYDGVNSFGICINQPSYMSKLSCVASTAGITVDIPCPDYTQPGTPSPDGPYFRSRYWFAGDDCSDDP